MLSITTVSNAAEYNDDLVVAIFHGVEITLEDIDENGRVVNKERIEEIQNSINKENTKNSNLRMQEVANDIDSLTDQGKSVIYSVIDTNYCTLYLVNEWDGINIDVTVSDDPYAVLVLDYVHIN